VVVALVAVGAYAATLGYDLVWDDTLLIQQSWRLPHWGELPQLLLSHFWSEVGETSHYYRPLISVTFFLDMKGWGLQPFGFHLTNLLAHMAVILAVLAVARRVTGSELAAVISALAFALHPLHTESVSFVSGRTDILAAIFFLPGLARLRPRPRSGAVAVHRVLARSLPARALRQGNRDHLARGARALGLAGARGSPRRAGGVARGGSLRSVSGCSRYTWAFGCSHSRASAIRPQAPGARRSRDS
jgi:hypothetical protein